MVIVDTSVWIDYLGGVANQHTFWLDRQLTRQRLGLTDLQYCRESLIIERSAECAAICQGSGFSLRVEKNLAVAVAQSYRSLRQSGYTVSKTIDCLMATFCLEAGHSALHRDHDFDPFESLLALRVIHH